MEEEEFLVNTGLESMNFIASFAVWWAALPKWLKKKV